MSNEQTSITLYLRDDKPKQQRYSVTPLFCYRQLWQIEAVDVKLMQIFTFTHSKIVCTILYGLARLVIRDGV